MPHRLAQLTQTLRLKREEALRVAYWLQRLHQRLLVHDNAQMLRFHHAQARSLIATVDFATKEVGCVWCGEFAAFFKEELDPTFKKVQIPMKEQPYEIRKLGLFPVLLYCEPCFRDNPHFLTELGYSSSSQSMMANMAAVSEPESVRTPSAKMS